jgi:hypothetical protein
LILYINCYPSHSFCLSGPSCYYILMLLSFYLFFLFSLTKCSRTYFSQGFYFDQSLITEPSTPSLETTGQSLYSVETTGQSFYSVPFDLPACHGYATSMCHSVPFDLSASHGYPTSMCQGFYFEPSISVFDPSIMTEPSTPSVETTGQSLYSSRSFYI